MMTSGMLVVMVMVIVMGMTSDNGDEVGGGNICNSDGSRNLCPPIKVLFTLTTIFLIVPTTLHYRYVFDEYIWYKTNSFLSTSLVSFCAVLEKISRYKTCLSASCECWQIFHDIFYGSIFNPHRHGKR